MSIWLKKLENFAPDISGVTKKFPLTIIFLAIGTLLVIALTNDYLPEKGDFWPLMALGFFTAAIFATAGRLFSQSRGGNIISIMFLEIIIPIAVISSMQIKSFSLFFPFFLPIIGVFWLSVSPFTKIGKGEERQKIQDKFWIVNHRAVASAIIAGAGFLIIALGVVAIERSLYFLFGLDISKIFYEYLLPFSGLFLVPLYWLSTTQDLDKISANELESPDFISKAIGFLGQFLFVPFLLAYALILLVYAVQIVFTQELPVGTLGWMVLGFTITGAVAWLLVYPSFMHQKTLVRLFRFSWFWLTLIPLIMFAIGVYIRVQAYGLTEPRMLLIAGGVWAILLSIFFLSNKLADIRLMPLLACVIFLVLSMGPFNISNLPIINQAARLQSAISNAIPIAQSTFENPQWSKEGAKKAIGALTYLYNDDAGKVKLQDLFSQNGLEYNPTSSLLDQLKQLKLDSFKSEDADIFHSLEPVNNNYPNLYDTPYYLGGVEIYKHASMPVYIGELGFGVSPKAININTKNSEVISIKLADWLKEQEDELLTNPEINFTIDNINYRLIVEFIAFNKNSSDDLDLERLEALLFSSEKPSAK